VTKHPVLVALAVVALAVVALLFDWHLYLFDRPEYLIRRAAEKCVAAEMAAADYNECKPLDIGTSAANIFELFMSSDMANAQLHTPQ
jgi:hypothetical protein